MKNGNTNVMRKDNTDFESIGAYRKGANWFVPVKVPLVWNPIGRIIEGRIAGSVAGMLDRDAMMLNKGYVVNRL